MKTENTDIQQELENFLQEWDNDSPFIQVKTSGSTGTPKQMQVRKEQMVNSARLTCQFLQLRPGDKALLCMPLQYIAGKMMVVRSLVAGLELVVRQPSGHPLADVDTPLRFAAMVPMQVYNSLQVPDERKRLEQTDILIIGGGSIDAALEKALQDLPGTVYSTYGMTETLSHIALRRLNGPDASAYYTPFPNVTLSLSEEETLVIDAPAVADRRLVTNDIAELLPDGRFRIIGRKDNVIISGGVKIQTESVEAALRPLMSSDFAITSVPDPKFGEVVVLLFAEPDSPNFLSGSQQLYCEGRNSTIAGVATDLLRGSQQHYCGSRNSTIAEVAKKLLKPNPPISLPKYSQPKYILPVEAIPMTGTGKIDRAGCRQLANQIINQLNS